MSQPSPPAALDETPINRDWMRVVWWFVLINFGLEAASLLIGDVQLRRVTIVASANSFRTAWSHGVLGFVDQVGGSLERLLTLALPVLAAVMVFARRAPEKAMWILVVAMAGAALHAVEFGFLAAFDPGLRGTLSEARMAIVFVRFVALGMLLAHYLKRANRQPSWVRVAGVYLLIAGIFTVSLYVFELLPFMRSHRQDVPWAYFLPPILRGMWSLVVGSILLARPSWRSIIFGITLLAELILFGFYVSSFVHDFQMTGRYLPISLEGTMSALLLFLLSIRKGEYWSPLALRCRGCGYSLVGLPSESHKCPECGAARVLATAINR